MVILLKTLNEKKGFLSRKQVSVLCIAALSFFLSCSSQTISPVPPKNEETPWKMGPTVPERLLLIVVDEFQDDFIEKYKLQNFARFKTHALNFTQASVGHLPTEEITSHTVIATGLLPKNLPFQGRVFRDTRGKLGTKGALYASSHLTRKNFEKLFSSTAPTNLHARLKRGHRGDTFTISNEASTAFALGSPYSDLLITHSPPKKNNPLKGWCSPWGVDVPKYFLYPFGGRFFIECENTYPNLPLKGNQYLPGNDPQHLGGDVWFADTILEVMKEESDWRAIFSTTRSVQESLTLNALYTDWTPFPQYTGSPIDLKTILTTLDTQFGKILDYLESKNLLKETLIVITSSHSGQYSRNLYHVTPLPEVLGTHFAGKIKNAPAYAVPDILNPLFKNPKIEAITFDTALKFFLNTKDPIEISKLATDISLLPGVMEVYARKFLTQGSQFIRTYRAKQIPTAQLEWAKNKNQELLSTMTRDSSPDLVAFLFDETGYGTAGDSGGAQSGLQKIPLYVWSPNLNLASVDKANGLTSPAPIKLVDLNPVISRLMGIPIPGELDGTRAPIDTLVWDP